MERDTGIEPASPPWKSGVLPLYESRLDFYIITIYNFIAMLNPKQRDVLAKKFADLGNIAVGSLVFGFVIKSELLNAYSLLIGLGVALAVYISAVVILGK